MQEIQATMTELRQNLGNLINQAAYGDDLVILVSPGKPKAAIVGIDDLMRLRQLRQPETAGQRPSHASLATADALRERIRRWELANDYEPEASIETLCRLPEEL